jgi:hypothetical protein
MVTATAIVKYDAMRHAIDTCLRVDVVKGIRDKAEALRHVAKVARNEEAERKCVEIRLRAERKAGQLLRDMRERGERRARNDGRSEQVSRGGTPAPNLRNLGISPNQSSRWQQLAEVPERQFEAGLRREGRAPTTNQFVRRSGGAVRPSSGDVEYYTPPEPVSVVRKVLGTIDLDPASCEMAQRTVKAEKFYTIVDDGLTKDWLGRTFLNPPFAQPFIRKFISKLITEIHSGRCTEAILLTHNCSDTGWFQKVAKVANALCLWDGRIEFINRDGHSVATATNGQVFFYFGDHEPVFAQHFAPHGTVVVPWGKLPVR